jgi:hypothetical protein
MISGQVDIPLLGRVDKKGLVVGASILLALLVVPKVSDYTVPLLTKIRNIIGGRA